MINNNQNGVKNVYTINNYEVLGLKIPEEMENEPFELKNLVPTHSVGEKFCEFIDIISDEDLYILLRKGMVQKNVDISLLGLEILYYLRIKAPIYQEIRIAATTESTAVQDMFLQLLNSSIENDQESIEDWISSGGINILLEYLSKPINIELKYNIFQTLTNLYNFKYGKELDEDFI